MKIEALPGRSKLENSEFMDRLVDSCAKNVEEFLDDSAWEDRKVLPGISRNEYTDTKTVVDAIRKREKLDDLSLPADVFIIIQTTCHSEFGLTIDESYKVLEIYFSDIFADHNSD